MGDIRKVTVRLSGESYEKCQQLCQQYGISQSRLFEVLIEQGLEGASKSASKVPAASISNLSSHIDPDEPFVKKSELISILKALLGEQMPAEMPALPATLTFSQLVTRLGLIEHQGEAVNLRNRNMDKPKSAEWMRSLDPDGYLWKPLDNDRATWYRIDR